MLKYLKLSVALIVIIIIALIVFVVYKINKTVVRQTKDYAIMYIEESDFIDSAVMKSPPDKFSQLLQIDFNTREAVAAYMEKNNLKLKTGKQEFVRNNPSLYELIYDGFLFERINGTQEDDSIVLTN